MPVTGSECCGLKHVVRVIHMSDADLRVCCFWDMMRRSNPRIVRTTFDNVFACVCFRSAVCFAKQNVFFRVCLELWPQARCSRHVHEPQGLAILVFQDVMRRSTPRIVPHHFKPRACLCLLSQCCAFRKAERVPRRVGTSCWSSGHSKSATFAFSRGNALFHVFAFVCPSRKGAGDAATKGARHEVLHQMLWRDKSGSHQLFFSVSVIDRRCPRMFGTSGGGAAVIGNIVLR